MIESLPVINRFHNLEARQTMSLVLYGDGEMRKLTQETVMSAHLDKVAEATDTMIVGQSEDIRHTYLSIAYLHDAIEDNNVSEQEIQEVFGDQVAQSVYFLSDTRFGEIDWKKRKEKFIQDLRQKNVSSDLLPIVTTIKIADVYCVMTELMGNISQFGIERIHQDLGSRKEEMLWYYDTIISALSNIANTERNMSLQQQFISEKLIPTKEALFTQLA